MTSRALALAVMKQDLIAACWQARMAGDGAGDAKATLAQCTATWSARPRTICILTEIQAFGTPAAAATMACSGRPHCTGGESEKRAPTPRMAWVG